jgi:hypothetical protein
LKGTSSNKLARRNFLKNLEDGRSSECGGEIFYKIKEKN